MRLIRCCVVRQALPIALGRAGALSGGPRVGRQMTAGQAWSRPRMELTNMSGGLDRSKLPMPDPSFSGSAGRTIGDSTPDWGIIGDVEPPAGPGGTVTLSADGQVIGKGRLAHQVAILF